MGLFGGSGDTSGSYNSGSDTFESKLRMPSTSTELDFSENSSLNSLGSSSGSDFETRIQIEQQKAELVGQVTCFSTCPKLLDNNSKINIRVLFNSSVSIAFINSISDP